MDRLSRVKVFHFEKDLWDLLQVVFFNHSFHIYKQRVSYEISVVLPQALAATFYMLPYNSAALNSDFFEISHMYKYA
jgi:hypothetical protein